MKKITLPHLAAVFLFLITATQQINCMSGSQYNIYDAIKPQYEGQKKPQGTLLAIITGLYMTATLPMQIIKQCTETPHLKHAFSAGYMYNFMRFGSLGRKNLFEWFAEKIGASNKYSPWVGTAAWNILALLTTNDHLNKYEYREYFDNKLSVSQKIKNRVAAFGACALGGIAGSAWRTIIYKGLSYSKQQLFSQCAGLIKIVKR